MAGALVPRLAVSHLTKRFGQLLANDDISLSVLPGEIHCLLGENGAGKSTLSSCLFGLYRPDAGSVRVDGRPIELRSPADAIAAGIGMVHQHFVLVPAFTALENILVGTGRGWRLDLAAARRAVRALCARYDLALELDRPVAELSLGEQQWVEIVKALYLGARLLILDEPTALLTPVESAKLFRVIMRMAREDGLAILLITHKMAEVMRSDRVTVLRKGRLIGTAATAEVSRDQLVRMMVGRDLASPRSEPRTGPATPLLRLAEVSLRDADGRRHLDAVSFELAAGEILGVAGVAGNGQTELFETIAGLRRPSSGSIYLAGTRIDGEDPAGIAALGLGHVPNDRARDGLVPDFSIAENLLLGQQWQPPWRRGWLLNRPAIRQRAATCIAEFAVAASGPEALVRRLSGGNAQKVVLARELAKASRVLLCNQPTRGLDVGVIEHVQSELLRRRAAGCAILLASEELDDLFSLADRIMVMVGGRVVALVDRPATDLATVGRLMAGQAAA